MNRRSILTKTGKGLMEATGKTSNLSRDLRSILKEIDGKVSVSDLLDKLDTTESKLLEALASMEREGYVREFVGKADEGPSTPAGRGPGSKGDASDLDFTAYTPAKKANEEARLQAQAQEIARQAQATRAREAAVAKARAEQATRAKPEAKPAPAAPATPAAPAGAAPYSGILGAGPDAHARAQSDALDRARREADERARKGAEEKARQEAEARARAEIEAAVQREAEERRRRETQERIRREDEERARREAEVRAKQDAELRAKREAEERLRREMEERAKREIEERLRREEEERRRREEEERVRREAERKQRIEAEARAKVDAELRARREAEERVRREEEERREAERRKRAEEEARKRREAEQAEALERALQEEQERARVEAEEGARRGEEEQAEREERERAEQEASEQQREEEEKQARDDERRARAEERAAAKAAAKQRKAERARERAGEEAWRGDEDALRGSREASLSAAELWEKRRPRSLLRSLAIMLLVLVAVGLAVLPFVPLETAAYEKAAAGWLGQPVKIGSVNLTLLPLPQLKFEKVVIGRDPQMRIAVIKASPELSSLLEDRVSLTSLALDNVTLPKEFIGALFQSKGARRTLGVQRITAKGLKIEPEDLGLVPLDLDARLAPDGGLASATFSNAERQLTLKVEPQGARAAIEISCSTLPLPIGVDFGLSDFQAKGTASASELTLSSVEGRAFGGRLLGSARLRWSNGWALDGELSARQMEAAKIAAPLLGAGTLQGRGTFSMRGLLPERMALNSQIEGSFTIQKGTINNVDMTRLLQGSGSGGGTTPFSEMSGNFNADSNRLLVRQIKLAAGLLSGAGQVEMDSQKNLSGRMQIELRAQSIQARAIVGVGGTLTTPQFRRSN